VSPTGSKTGRPFLANGPRRSTRVGEPSRRFGFYAPEPYGFCRTAPGHRSRRSESTCRMAFPSPFLFLSPSTSSSSARFRIRSWSARPNSVSRRRLPVSAFTFSTAPTTFPIVSNRERLETANVPPSPRRETAAWQSRCFPPLGIDVHEARAYCVHRQVLRPRRRPFDRVPLPLEEGEFAFAVRRGRAFFYLTLLPDFDCVEQCLHTFGGPLAEHRIDLFPREFSRGCRYGIVRLGHPGQVTEGILRSSRRLPRAQRMSCLTTRPG
jgi:hypothetical protein